MAVNIEVKARVKDSAKLRSLLAEITDQPCEEILQEDIFFYTPKGRLKLRVLGPDRGEFIYYERNNVAGPKLSKYLISPSSDPGSLRSLLATALSVRGTVRKQRLLYKIGNTRIHLDMVDDLGCFVELEVVLGKNQTPEQGRAVADDIMQKLAIQPSDLIKEAYIDLLERLAT